MLLINSEAELTVLKEAFFNAILDVREYGVKINNPEYSISDQERAFSVSAMLKGVEAIIDNTTVEIIYNGMLGKRLDTLTKLSSIKGANQPSSISLTDKTKTISAHTYNELIGLLSGPIEDKLNVCSLIKNEDVQLRLKEGDSLKINWLFFGAINDLRNSTSFKLFSYRQMIEFVKTMIN